MPCATTAPVTPLAASDLYEQQYQMARLAQSFYRRAVAVNDLGLVAHGNNNYALDLWGLGSEQVRKARTAGQAGHHRAVTLSHRSCPVEEERVILGSFPGMYDVRR